MLLVRVNLAHNVRVNVALRRVRASIVLVLVFIVSVCVTLFTRHVMRMRHIVIVPCTAPHYFFLHYHIYGTIFFDFLYSLCLKHFSF